MLTRKGAQRGVTLIELMIGLVIVAAVLMAGVPTFATWMQNTQIRSAAETIRTGLVIAQTEALRRNATVRFQLTSSLDNSCTLTTNSTNWVINAGNSTENDPTAGCGTAPSDKNAPFIIKARAAAEGSRNVVARSSQPTAVIVFNSYGKVINLPADVQNMSIDLSNPAGGACAADGGPMACMRLVVSTSGQIRMCNPAQPTDPVNPMSTPQGC